MPTTMAAEGMDFIDCVMFCARQRGFVEQIDRLRGTNFAAVGRRSPLDAMIDKASGVEDQQAAEFMAIVLDLVWMRLPDDAFTDATRTRLIAGKVPRGE